MRAVLQYRPLASTPLDKITTEKIAEFAAHRQALKMQISSVNNTLRALRRCYAWLLNGASWKSPHRLRNYLGSGTWNAPRGMLPSPMGCCYVVQRASRFPNGDSW